MRQAGESRSADGEFSEEDYRQNGVVVASPRTTKWVAVVLSVVLLAVTLGLWWTLGSDIRSRFTWPQTLTLVVFLVIGIGFMLGMGFSEVRADAAGLRIRNGIARHAVRWDEVKGIRFRDGDPWAYAVLRENHPSGRERLQLLGIQQTDGARAFYMAQAVARCRPVGGGEDELTAR